MKFVSELIIMLPGGDNWPAWWSQMYEKYKDADEFDYEERLRVVQGMMSCYAGMCSFNDTNYPAEIERFKGEIYLKLEAEARKFWKLTGRKSYSDDEFSKFSVGDKVHLLKDQILFIDRMGAEHRADFVHDHEYSIVENSDLEITGMPLYTVQHGHTYRVARHTGLRKS